MVNISFPFTLIILICWKKRIYYRGRYRTLGAASKESGLGLIVDKPT